MGFFRSFFNAVEDIGGGFVDALKGGVQGVNQAVNRAAEVIAEPLGVHPDAVKAAAALMGYYYTAGGSFVNAAGEAVADAVVAEAVAPVISSSGVIGAAAPAAGAGLSAAEIAALGAEGLAVPAATATAFPVATAPLAPIGSLGNAGIDASLGQAYNALGVGANALTPTAATTAAGANALSPEALAALDAGLGGVPASAAGTAALSPETLAALDAGLGGVPATAATGAGAGAGAAATGANISGYGGYGDVLNPVTGAVIPGAGAAALTGAGLAGAAGAAGAGALGANALVPLALAGTGALGAITARSAAETQADAARYAADKAYQVYQEQKALQEPFRTAGISAQNQLLTLLGLPGGTQGAEFGRYARPFGMQDFQADPGHAFRLSEGMKALEASRAARGGLLSGATGKALSRYGQDLASQEYGNAFNRFQTERANRLQPLGSLMGTGQAAASNQATAAGQYGTNVGNLATSGAAAQAAGQVGMTNALTGALNTYLNYSANQNMVNALQDAAVRRASMYGL